MEAQAADPSQVAEFRQILLWPLQLNPNQNGAGLGAHWSLLDSAAGQPWQELADEFTEDPAQFQERHYREFTAFLPYVQRLLYGEGKARDARQGAHAAGESPIHVYRRRDIAQARVRYPDGVSVVFQVVHVDLYFFHGMDVAILVLELRGEQLSLSRVQETLYRFGRVYPTHWQADGRAAHCLDSVEWLSASGDVLAESDYQARQRYLEQVCQQRAPRIAAHWEYLLRPLVPHYSNASGSVRYRLVDHHRMPVMAFLAVNEPQQLSRADFVRLALLSAPGPSDVLPLPAAELADFEQRCCSDRYWLAPDSDASNARYLCSGSAFVLVGRADDARFTSVEHGLLAQFRHQDFWLFFLPHLQKSALFMISDRLVDALNHLSIRDAASVRSFKRKIRELKRVLLAFTHGYWFQQVAAQPHAKQLYRMCQRWLDTERIHSEVRDEVEDMNQYLDSDALRRQASTVVRLTVVTLFGLIGTLTTGFLGMNLLAEADSPLWQRLGWFIAVLVPTIWLTLYTIMKSQRLSDFLDALSDERLPARAKLAALAGVWRRREKGSE